jgi:hypothetical protein
MAYGVGIRKSFQKRLEAKGGQVLGRDELRDILNWAGLDPAGLPLDAHSSCTRAKSGIDRDGIENAGMACRVSDPAVVERSDRIKTVVRGAMRLNKTYRMTLASGAIPTGDRGVVCPPRWRSSGLAIDGRLHVVRRKTTSKRRDRTARRTSPDPVELLDQRCWTNEDVFYTTGDDSLRRRRAAVAIRVRYSRETSSC